MAVAHFRFGVPGHRQTSETLAAQIFDFSHAKGLPGWPAAGSWIDRRHHLAAGRGERPGRHPTCIPSSLSAPKRVLETPLPYLLLTTQL
jgi:hypothetical protein